MYSYFKILAIFHTLYNISSQFIFLPNSLYLLPLPLILSLPPSYLIATEQEAGEAEVTAKYATGTGPKPRNTNSQTGALSHQAALPISRPQLLLAGLTFCPLLMLWFSSGYSLSTIFLCIHPCINQCIEMVILHL